MKKNKVAIINHKSLALSKLVYKHFKDAPVAVTKDYTEVFSDVMLIRVSNPDKDLNWFRPPENTEYEYTDEKIFLNEKTLNKATKIAQTVIDKNWELSNYVVVSDSNKEIICKFNDKTNDIELKQKKIAPDYPNTEKVLKDRLKIKNKIEATISVDALESIVKTLKHYKRDVVTFKFIDNSSPIIAENDEHDEKITILFMPMVKTE